MAGEVDTNHLVSPCSQQRLGMYRCGTRRVSLMFECLIFDHSALWEKPSKPC